MRCLILFIIVYSFTINECVSQSFINGDFEINTSVDCDYNLVDSVFNTRISNITAFGKGYFPPAGGYVGETDLQTLGCYLDPQSGNWCIGLSSDTTSTSDAIAIELTTNLIAGNAYELSFYIYGNTSFHNALSNIEVGETQSDTLFGTLIDSISPDTNNWKHVLLVFTATQNSSHISVRTKIGMPGWTQIDNFSITPTTTSVEEHNQKPVLIAYPSPASTNVNVEFHEYITSGVVSIISLSGQLLSKSRIDYNRDINLDLKSIPSGVYLIRIESDQFSESVRLIKK